MDPIGCAASVGGLIAICCNVISFIGKTKAGRSERKKLEVEVDHTYRVLRSIEDQFDAKDFVKDGSWFRCIEKLFQPGDEMEHLERVLNEIAAKLEIKSTSRVAGLVSTLKWPIDSVEIDAMTAEVEKIKTNINMTLIRANYELGIDTNTRVTQLQSTLTKFETLRVIEWISPLDFRGMQQSPQKRALENTGQWFFEKMEYLGWVDRRVPSLWCHGIPGAGKTFLASAAFDRTRSLLQDDSPLVMIVFFDFNDKGTHSVEAMLSSLLRQTVEHRQSISEKVQSLYDGSTLVDRAGRPSMEALRSALKAEFEHVRHTYVILDGLDEVPSEKKRFDILSEVEALDSGLQLMVFSRPLLDIKTWFSGQTRNHRCQISQTVGHAREIHASDDSDSDMLSVDSDEMHAMVWGSSALPVCEVCHISGSGRPPLSQKAYYECQCQCTLCGSCYDRIDKCIGCNSDKTSIKYMWPQQVEITARPEDLELYVRWRIDDNPTLTRHFKRNANLKSTNGLKTDIIKAVVNNSGQMFLLAKLHLDKLSNLATVREMLTSVESLHSNVHLLYEDVFKRIETFAVATHILRLIQIVVFVREPLEITSLEHAIAISQGHESIDPLDLPDATDLVNKCLGLVTVDDQNIVRLSHETVGAYVRQRESQQPDNGDAVMAGVCISYICHVTKTAALEGPQQIQHLEAQKHEFPLLSYSATYWSQHVRRAASHDTNVVAQSFLEDDGRIAMLAQIMWHDNLERGSGWDAEDGVTGLHIAAHFGLNHALSTILANGESVDTVDCMGTTPLMYAVSAGHDEAVGILLYANADASLRCRRGRTALHRACTNMDVPMLRQLVNSSRDIAVNAVDEWANHKRAIHIIAQAGNVEMLRILLSRLDIDVNLPTETRNKETALHFALYSWRTDTLSTLLDDKRIEIDKTNAGSITALNAACYADQYDDVALLLDRGANPHIADDQGGHPLLRAIDGNGISTVRLLIEREVDYRFVDFFGRGVLHACAVNGRAQILRYLLLTKADLDPNAQGDRGETPLHDAVTHGWPRVVNILLDFGARTDVRDNEGTTPLRAAREANKPDLFNMLAKARQKEENAASVSAEAVAVASDSLVHRGITHSNTLDPNEQLTIHAAVRFFDLGQLKTYLEAQGDGISGIINRPDNVKKQTAVQIAAEEAKPGSMRLLIEYGADINVQDMWGMTALHLSAFDGSLDAVEVLLGHAASINIKDTLDRTPMDCALLALNYNRRAGMDTAMLLVKHGGLTAHYDTRLLWVLQAAVETNQLEIVKRICSQGVQCHVKLGGRMTPYQLAKKKGFSEIADFLLEEMKRGESVGFDSKTAQASPSDTLRLSDAAGVPPTIEAQEAASPDKPTSLTDTDAHAEASAERRGGVVLSVKTQLNLTTRECCMMAVILALLVPLCLRRPVVVESVNQLIIEEHMI